MKQSGFVVQATREGVNRARQIADEAVALDPKYPTAYYALGLVHVLDAFLGLSKDRKGSIESSNKILQKAIALDGSFADPRALLAFNFVMLGRHDEAVAEGERAYQLAPNSSGVLYWYGTILPTVGRGEEAVPLLKEVLRLNPRPSNAELRSIAFALRVAGRYEEAIDYLKRAVEREPESSHRTHGPGGELHHDGSRGRGPRGSKGGLEDQSQNHPAFPLYPAEGPRCRGTLCRGPGEGWAEVIERNLQQIPSSLTYAHFHP